MQQDEVTKNKKLKDPIYGYISIPQEYIKNVIDTPVFQRLRRVLQTSYSPLYASTLHNRFVHSLGVYHLGDIVAKRFTKVIKEKGYFPSDKIEKVEKYAKVYRLACLLHDVGHAPFSHTGENYFKDKEGSSDKLHERLCSLFISNDFKNDIPPITERKSAAAHEIMSAIVGIKEFGSIIGDDESKELFARCITGYTYNTKIEKDSEKQMAIDELAEKDIKNCFISMLNSDVIDVDRLDYLIRDAYTSGFETVNIDYNRLLRALTIVVKNRHYIPAYKKGAVSIIENVVYAHDAEKKWIQTHPVVLYEMYILSHILERLSLNLDVINKRSPKKSKKLFSEESLSVEGQLLKDKVKVSLMCDDDIIYLSKNLFPDKLSMEFFDRNCRMHPVWKSEAEYKGYIASLGEDKKNLFIDTVEGLCKRERKYNMEYCVIDQSLLDNINEELDKAVNNCKTSTIPLELEEYEARKNRLIRQVQVCNYLLNQAVKHEWEPQFLFIEATMFNSNFEKEKLKNMLIAFGNKEEPRYFKQVCSLLDASKNDEKFYYLYYRKKKKYQKDSEEFSVTNFCEELMDNLEIRKSR